MIKRLLPPIKFNKNVEIAPGILLPPGKRTKKADAFDTERPDVSFVRIKLLKDFLLCCHIKIMAGFAGFDKLLFRETYPARFLSASRRSRIFFS